MCRLLLLIGVFAAACVVGRGAAWAASQTWVSGTGANAGSCPRTAPCRTFQYAANNTDPNGVINVLSAGDFGPLTIANPLSIIAHGVEAGITSAKNGAAITISAPTHADILLRGLTIDLRGTANDGIVFLSGRALHLYKSVVRNAVNGILFRPTDTTRGLYVTDSVIADSAERGILVTPITTGGATVVLDRVRVHSGGGEGIYLVGSSTTGTIAATIRNSAVVGHSAAGIAAAGSGGGSTSAAVVRSAAALNGTGVTVNGPNVTIHISNATTTGNATGLASFSNGEIVSLGNNNVSGNTTDGAPTSIIAQQ